MKIKGLNIIILVADNQDTYRSVALAVTCDADINVSYTETGSPAAGSWVQNKVRTVEWALHIQHLMSDLGDGLYRELYEGKEVAVRFTTALDYIQPGDPTYTINSNFYLFGSAVVTKIQSTGSTADYATATATLTGSGPLYRVDYNNDIERYFDEYGNAKNANKLGGKSLEELFESLDAEGGINLVIGGVSKSVTKSELLLMLGFVDTGKHNQPVYYEDEELKVIDSLRIGGSIESLNGGVSAKGISDFGTPSGAGGAVGIDVLRDDELESLQAESITQVASAWSVKRIKDVINIEDVPTFNPSLSYERGEYVLYNGTAWKFVENHKGEWNSGHCKSVDINDILTPSNVYVEDLINKYFR